MPTDDTEVKAKLRELGEPICAFVGLRRDTVCVCASTCSLLCVQV